MNLKGLRDKIIVKKEYKVCIEQYDEDYGIGDELKSYDTITEFLNDEDFMADAEVKYITCWDDESIDKTTVICIRVDEADSEESISVSEFEEIAEEIGQSVGKVHPNLAGIILNCEVYPQKLVQEAVATFEELKEFPVESIEIGYEQEETRRGVMEFLHFRINPELPYGFTLWDMQN